MSQDMKRQQATRHTTGVIQNSRTDPPMITQTNEGLQTLSFVAGSHKLRHKYNSVIPTSGVEAHTHVHYNQQPGTRSEITTSRPLLDDLPLLPELRLIFSIMSQKISP